ncbi:MAG TPA: hypothetical protein VMF90_05700 [Rhizobiaceae bacterium]|nr:hypothetical protein [Rhizobiaceae bacterium]
MTKALLVAAALGFTISSASACEFMRSAKKLDTTTTASTQTENMSAPVVTPEEQASVKKPLSKEDDS